MTEPHDSSNEMVSSPAHQAADPDWKAVALQLASALADAQKSKTDPIARLSLIVSIVSMISTIILGTVVSGYLQTKQAETNIKYSFAHLALDALPVSSCHSKIPLGCLVELQVTNKGPALATGVTIDVFIKNVAPMWLAAIKDMSDFTITTSPSNVKVSKSLLNDPDPSALLTVAKNNAYELTITNLPPNNPGITVALGLSPRIPVVAETMSINTVLYITSQNSQNVNFGNGFPTIQAIQKYFDQFFSIADFGIDVTCQNCTDNPNPLVSSTSSLDNDAFSSSLNPQNLLDSIWAGSVSVTYDRPQRASRPLIGDSLYLWTEPDNTTAALDSATQTYLGVVTTCKPLGQSGGSQDTCIPTFANTGS